MQRKRWAAAVAGLVLVGCAACGSPESGGTADEGDDGADLGALGTAVPSCPVTVEQVSQIVGQPMEEDTSCSFDDGRGVALLTITMSSQLAGESTYDYQRDVATKSYDTVEDLQRGSKGYLAYKDIHGEAVVISPNGAYTVTMSSFSFEPDQYPSALRKLVDTFPL